MRCLCIYQVREEAGGFEFESEIFEIRAKSTHIHHTTLEKFIKSDALLINFYSGFFILFYEKVRLTGINAPELSKKKEKEVMAFIEKELKDANLIVEKRKKEKYGRYLAYVYYCKESKDFEDIIRHGKLLNEELVKVGYTESYKAN